MARIVVNGAKQCPFCGCTKMFQKIWDDNHYRYGASVQCSKCHIDGPKVYSKESDKFIPAICKADKEIIDDLCARSLEKWNERH